MSYFTSAFTTKRKCRQVPFDWHLSLFKLQPKQWYILLHIQVKLPGQIPSQRTHSTEYFSISSLSYNPKIISLLLIQCPDGQHVLSKHNQGHKLSCNQHKLQNCSIPASHQDTSTHLNGCSLSLAERPLTKRSTAKGQELETSLILSASTHGDLSCDTVHFKPKAWRPLKLDLWSVSCQFIHGTFRPDCSCGSKPSQVLVSGSGVPHMKKQKPAEARRPQSGPGDSWTSWALSSY